LQSQFPTIRYRGESDGCSTEFDLLLRKKEIKAMNTKLIRIEGLVVLVLGTYLYFTNGYNWAIFLLLLMVPDVFMIGYAFSKKSGAYVYNFAHPYVTPLLLLLAGLAFSVDLLMMIGLIWIVHIGMDRMMGYGLKYVTDFKDTHIQRL